jgi:hypothetical protein
VALIITIASNILILLILIGVSIAIQEIVLPTFHEIPPRQSFDYGADDRRNMHHTWWLRYTHAVRPPDSHQTAPISDCLANL